MNLSCRDCPASNILDIVFPNGKICNNNRVCFNEIELINSKLDVDLSSWNITIPIIWEFIDEQQNNVGKVTIQYIKNGSTVADSVCEVELFNQ